MAYARPFSTSTLQDLFNGVKNTSRRGVLTLQLSSEVLGVPKDSKFALLGVRVSSSHLPESGVATDMVLSCKTKINPITQTKKHVT